MGKASLQRNFHAQAVHDALEARIAGLSASGIKEFALSAGGKTLAALSPQQRYGLIKSLNAKPDHSPTSLQRRDRAIAYLLALQPYPAAYANFETSWVAGLMDTDVMKDIISRKTKIQRDEALTLARQIAVQQMRIFRNLSGLRYSPSARIGTFEAAATGNAHHIRLQPARHVLTQKYVALAGQFLAPLHSTRAIDINIHTDALYFMTPKNLAQTVVQEQAHDMIVTLRNRQQTDEAFAGMHPLGSVLDALLLEESMGDVLYQHKVLTPFTLARRIASRFERKIDAAMNQREVLDEDIYLAYTLRDRFPEDAGHGRRLIVDTHFPFPLDMQIAALGNMARRWFKPSAPLPS